MIFYSNVPLAKEGVCPSHLDHNRLAHQFNLRLRRSGPDCAWRIFYYADSIFLGMRNPGTPEVPMGFNPPEDEWWKVYMNIEYPAGSLRDGWPKAFAGTAEGANVMNPLNAFIFGRKTAENRQLEKIGPWAEGNVFDEMVESSRAVLSNKQYWESAFRQRGAIARNQDPEGNWTGYYIGDVSPFAGPGGRVPGALGRVYADYFTSPEDPVFFSRGLFQAGRSGDKYFKEYASNTLYMRYPPAIKHGVYVKYGEAHLAPHGVLKRKNAAKDLLNWGLWVYTYYFRGAEHQRSLFCEGGGEAPFRRPWSSTVIDVDTTKEYAGQHTPFIAKNVHYGPLSICKVGFDFYKYFTRQNVFAPVLGEPPGISGHGGLYHRLDGTGNLKIEPYRVIYKFEIPIVTSSAQSKHKKGFFAFCAAIGLNTSPVTRAHLENYDNHGSGESLGGKGGFYGKTIRFKKAYMSKTKFNISFLMRCSYESINLGNVGRHRGGGAYFTYKDLTRPDIWVDHNGSRPHPHIGLSDTTRLPAKFDGCLAGYYLQTTAVENSSMKFKLRIWGGYSTASSAMKIVHETIIKKKYSYAVNRNADRHRTGKRAYIFNKMHYFKEGIDYPYMRFEIVPTEVDKNPRINLDKYKTDRLISFGNSFSSTIARDYVIEGEIIDGQPVGSMWGKALSKEASYEAVTAGSITNDSIANLESGDRWYVYPNSLVSKVERSHLIHEAAAPYLTTGDMVKIKYQYLKTRVGGYLGYQRAGGPVSLSDDTTVSGYVLNGQVLFVRKEETGSVIDVDSITGPDPNDIYARALVETCVAHGLESGDSVVISGASPDAYNRPFSVTVVDDDSFKISVEYGLDDATGAIVAQTKPESAKLYFYKRQDDRLSKREGDAEGETGVVGPVVDIYESLQVVPSAEEEDSKNIVIERMQPPTELFSVTLDLAVLLKTKPTFHDLYALLRVTTGKHNRRNNSSNIIYGDGEGIGTVGHHFTESNRVWKNYYKYGSGMNVYGSGAVPALHMYVSANPIYESMRKFVSSFMRFAGRRELLNYTIEGGRGVLYFRRYSWGFPKKAKATILRNMEPSIDPVGWFDSGGYTGGHTKFIPIKKNKKYRVVCTQQAFAVVNGKLTAVGREFNIVYNKITYTNGAIFTGGDKEYLDAANGINTSLEGAFELDGMENTTSSETNEWIMFMTSAHYHWSNTNIYKPDLYTDIMGFLNNRCHHRSKEYERGIGDQYDMIRTELCRIMPGTRNEPGPRLHIFLSKSSSNFTYVFNTNDPYQGNLGLYAEHTIPPYDYFRSCPPITPQPYKVISTEVVSSRGSVGWNPSSRTINGQMPSVIIKVTLDRPLRKTGRLSVGRSGWRSVKPAKLQKEPYRTDENAVIEYLHHLAGGYHCKRNMIGDYGASSDVIEGVGYRPFGACYPRFYFLKLIPKVTAGAILNTEPYAQMDFYLRAMGGAFINPYATPIYRQTSALNWQFGELASRSVEEDPTLYDYIDPRNIQS